MIDISVTDLVKSFDLEKKILDGISFQVDTGERVGLLGKNGAGKTTLFNILTGDLDYDSGEVLIAPGRRVGLISQIPVYPAGYTVEDVLRSAFQRTTALKEEMDRLTRQMEQGDSDPQTLRRYGELTARFEGLGGYDTDTAVNKVSNGLSIDGDMRRRLFDQLSGGEKTRVNLGRLILEDTDILLLDEPTNHLTFRPPSGWRSISAPSGAPWSPSPTTAISWTAPSPASSRSWTVRRSFTAATTAFMPLKRSAATRSA